MEDLANFARLVEAIRPWLAHMVIVGGWAHRLHRFHPLATAQEYQPLRTRDVDLAFSPDAPLRGDLRKALILIGKCTGKLTGRILRGLIAPIGII